MDETPKSINNLHQQAINNYIQNDPFARWLGARVEIVEPGHSRVFLTVKEEMANFHGITHGGIVFAIGDMAFAAASNSYGQTAVALNVAIHFLRETRPGDRLVAEARQEHMGGRTALYSITVREEKSGNLVAKSQDLVYRKKHWFVDRTIDP
jgi:acyl-CoA thioesterase